MGMVHDRGNAVPFHGDHHPVKVTTHRKSRNLFNQSLFNTEVNGITFSTDEDGTITVNGKPNTTGTYYYFRDFPAGTYSISVRFLTPRGDESNKPLGVRVRNAENKQYVQFIDTGIDYASAQVENEAYQQLKIGILVSKDITYDNYKLQIQFEEGSESTEYEPYGLIDEPIFEPIDQAKDGKTLTFENTYNDAAEVTVFGESTQETLSGKNLLQTGINPSKTAYGVTYIRNDDGSVTVNGTATDVAYFNLDFIGYVDSAVNYWTDYIGREITVSGGNYGVGLTCGLFTEDGNAKNICSSVYGNATTATVPDEAYKMRCYLYVRNGTIVDNVTIYPQIELGSTATEYEPYCGGIPSPNPDYPQPIESIKSVELASSNADGSKSATRTIDLQGHELRSLPDGTHDELVVHRDGTVELVLRCDASMFDPSYPVSSEWKLATPQTIQLPSIDPLPTYYPYTVVDGNGADISAHVRVFE